MIFGLVSLAMAQPDGSDGESAGPPAASVRLETAKRMEVRQRRQVVGHVQAARRSMVTAEEPGRVVAAPPEPGTAVDKGEELARVDRSLIVHERDAARAAVAEAEATIAERKAELELRRRDRKRIKELVDQNVAREKELKDARDEEAAAEARLALARAALRRREAELARLETRIDKTAIHAPFGGHVVEKRTELGEWIAAGRAVAEMIETDHVKVQLDVPETMIQQVPRGEPIILRFDALASNREAEVFRIVPDGDRQARTFRVLFRLANPDGTVKPGMSVSAELPTERTITAMTVPKDAVQTTPTGSVVYASRGGTAVPVQVRIRFSVDGRFVIEGELRDGESVVVEGNERLKPGQPLKPMKDSEPEQASASP